MSETLREIYLGSKKIKEQIVSRSTKFKIPLMHACKEVGVSYEDFLTKYINPVEHRNPKITERQFTRMLELYGITVKPLIIIDENYKAEEIKKYLAEQFTKTRKHDSEETGTDAEVQEGGSGVDSYEL